MLELARKHWLSEDSNRPAPSGTNRSPAFCHLGSVPGMDRHPWDLCINCANTIRVWPNPGLTKVHNKTLPHGDGGGGWSDSCSKALADVLHPPLTPKDASPSPHFSAQIRLGPLKHHSSSSILRPVVRAWPLDHADCGCVTSAKPKPKAVISEL
ncbi:hypothetical protein GQ53DRAFT_92985 [Thozetella sp. PMI_491]|nr:hypothetical protein GQ53DRAFT_92985 [Thozetella sp. PMI_491]